MAASLAAAGRALPSLRTCLTACAGSLLPHLAGARWSSSESQVRHEDFSEHQRHQPEPEWHDRGESEGKLRHSLLEGALRHVGQLGWSQEALAAAARELGLSPAAAGLLGKAEVELVQYFVERCNRRLSQELALVQQEEADLSTRERLQLGCQTRLQMVTPYISSWPQALALLAAPAALPRTAALYTDLADRIWRSAGDSSTNLSWYSKRALLTGVYASTELYMLTDCSPGFADTWAALGRRLDDALALPGLGLGGDDGA